MQRDWLYVVVAGCGLVSWAASGVAAQEVVLDPASECETDEDCAEGQECQVTGASAPGCNPEEGCDDLPPPTELRECVEAPLYCESDDDCPTGLVCELEEQGESCAISSDGQMFCPEPDPDAARGRCAFELVACDDASDCGANEECVPIGGSEECSDVAIACAPGEDCEIPEPVCEVVEENFGCFPALIECEVQEECPAGWDCFDFTQAEDGEPPPWWEEDVQVACLPEGIILAAMGADVGTTGDAEDFGRSEASGDDGGAVATGGEPQMDTANAAGGEVDGPAGDGGGGGLCAVGAGNPLHAALWLLPLLGWLRRRAG